MSDSRPDVLPVRAVVGAQQEYHLSGGRRVTKQRGLPITPGGWQQRRFHDRSLQRQLDGARQPGRIAHGNLVHLTFHGLEGHRAQTCRDRL